MGNKRGHCGVGLLCPSMGRTNGHRFLTESLGIGCQGYGLLFQVLEMHQIIGGAVFQKGLSFKVGEGR